ncbi:DedA family protein [Roseomonas terrae]|jgi:membrane protein DedA with SNARE-associated domain|uniref:DedA family protein n=1 Tax=Neoroseomonas terrae TaxID=424799 RepID=A0ABS5EDP1_9PROT|nr:DedA family protein [Neoroseomonas terrae]MBR0649143.1 DedA family protein [Neoroseomonas terrae]
MFQWVTEMVAAGGLWGVFALMVLENLFPPIPSELIMAASGFAAARGQMSLPWLIVFAVAGTVVGNIVWYELGRWLGVERFRPLVARYGKWFAVEEEDLDRATGLLRRWGPFAICIGRMFPGVRTLISVPAGMVGIRRGVFYLWTALGSAVWLTFLALAGYFLEEHYDKVEGWVEPLAWVVVGVAVGGYAAHLIFAFRRARRRRQG